MVERLGPGVVVNGRYALVTPLGEGGFGEVWRARDASLERDVALKFMRPELLRNESLRRRFEREATALAAVSHPHVVQVIDRGEWQGRPIVIMEFVAGETLRAWLERHPGGGPLAEVKSIFAQVCEGVGAAHDRGIVHRDLKPENVLLAQVGRRSAAKVLDFGLARIGGGQSSVMMTVGTYEYMSPEQASEGSEDVDARSDVFALGVLLVEMLTGQRFPGDGKKSWERVVDNGRGAEFVGRAAAKRPEVPAAVWNVVGQAIAKQPDERFADAEALRAAVEAAWSGAVASAEQPPPARAATARMSEPAPMPSVIAMPSMVEVRATQPPRVEPAPVRTVKAADPIVTHGTMPRPESALDAASGSIRPAGGIRFPKWLGASLLLGLVGVPVVYGIVTSAPRTPTMTPSTSSATADVGAPPAHPPVPTVASPPAPAPMPTPVTTCPEGMVRIEGGALATTGSALAAGTVPAFCVDRTEVTVRAFRACINARRCALASPEVRFAGVTAAMHRRYDPYCTLSPRFADSAEMPINCITYDAAREYCEQRRARLPSEVEWEFAARGNEGREYPWGNAAVDRTRLNACGEAECPRGMMFAGQDGFAAPAPVGTFPPGNTPAGVADLAGNVAEWVSGEGVGYTYGVRGGGWSTVDSTAVRGAARDEAAGSDRRPEVGFRCASDLR